MNENTDADVAELREEAFRFGGELYKRVGGDLTEEDVIRLVSAFSSALVGHETEVEPRRIETSTRASGTLDEADIDVSAGSSEEEDVAQAVVTLVGAHGLRALPGALTRVLHAVISSAIQERLFDDADTGGLSANALVSQALGDALAVSVITADEADSDGTRH